MSADVLRAAADLMRVRAEAATPGPWSTVSGAANVWRFPEQGSPTVVVPGNGTQGHHVRLPDAEHIASWHPAVALAVADWLDSVRAPDDPHTLAEAESKRCRLCAEYHRALAVARAYLGRDS